MKCENWKDLQNLIIQSEIMPQKNKISKEEYLKLWNESTSKAQKIWEKLLELNKKFYNKDKYLDIEYLSDKNIYRRKPLGRGRPKEADNKDFRLTVRLDKYSMDKLIKYCQTKNISESEAIRQAIQMLSIY